MPRLATGSSGRWVGVLAAAIVFMTLVLAPAARATATFVVDSIGDGTDANTVDNVCDDGAGHCTLRAAIAQANVTTGTDQIFFGIAGGSVHSIAPLTQLPPVTGPVTIDGYTQPGSSTNTQSGGDNAVLTIELRGDSLSAGGTGLIVQAASVIRGLAVNRFSAGGIALQTVGGSAVRGNFIGTDATGTSDPTPNNSVTAPGVRVSSGPGNVIGGSVPADRNVISGNNGVGVFITGSTSTGNSVTGNFIGTSRLGNGALPNFGSGVRVDGATGGVIGGTTVAVRNVISGNASSGVELTSGATNTINIQGNFIGTTAGGTNPLGNVASGVSITDAKSNLVGGTTGGARNIISGNATGVFVAGAAATGNAIQNNFIGTTPNGASAVANDTGVAVSGAPSTTIGGATTSAKNVISGNTDQGVQVAAGLATVKSNFIGTSASGAAAVPNGDDGLNISGPDATVGGAVNAGRNVISGNGGDGIEITGSSATSASIVGNLIGTTSAATAALGNDGDGVRVSAGAAATDVGGAGSTPGTFPGNVIAGNNGSGVEVAGSDNTHIDDNLIGVASGGVLPLPNNDDGVTVRDGADATTIGSVGANVISGNELSGVFVGGSTTAHTVVTGNGIGLNANGNVAVANQNGVEISGASHDNLVSSNFVSGNRNEGVLIDGAGTTGNVVSSNRIGLNRLGTAAIPNQQGVVVSGGAQLNTIGGTGTGKISNIIGGNTAEGVLLTGSGTNRNLVRGALIGTNAAGTAALPNATGVSIAAGARTNTVGSANPKPPTLISGNTSAGVRIGDTGTRSNRVQGAVIGLDVAGTGAMPNATGILVTNDARDTTVGGGSAAVGNTIARNAHSGVEVSGTTTSGTDIARNRTFLNGGLGINLRPGAEAADTATANDAGDGDSGANALQNFPVLTSVVGTAGGTTVNGTLNSTPNSQFRIDVFRNPVGTTLANAEGQDYVGSVTATTNASGNGPFTLTATPDFSGQVFKATATNTATRNTSELSAGVAAT